MQVASLAWLRAFDPGVIQDYDASFGFPCPRSLAQNMYQEHYVPKKLRQVLE